MASGGGRRRGSRRGKAKKKPKYLSLTRHLTKAVDARESKALSLECSPPSALTSPSLEEAVETQPPEDGVDGGEQQQLEGFGLHPEAPSLTDILGASSSSAGGGREESSCGASPDVSPGGTGRFTGEEEDLARRALRGRERWVYCSSSSSSPPSAATTTTTSSSCSSSASTGASVLSPLLKLDYEEILAAWADRGSLYIGGAAGHAAPELELDSVFVEVWPSTRHVAAAGAAWGAPEMVAERAEKVRRYREKRQGRLFSKRIRYEVRRINAVQRPRLKGRFIKENEGAAMADGGDLQSSS